ncbi:MULTISPECIES: hypothetical protein [unclassified Pedobacter]|uniref:hypothetical protein n=1 Tax=Pedobacter TaxID=84567 RepID=UPI002246AF34|nr:MULTISPECIES: hypothetical protein [unclassified Pedobacter]MCX2432894.1 hypothetical protein [Pedobacter sp. GR22-10]MCX2586032.1 hypothetical protein [Pedobacter sp. MR22-3]
MHKFSFVKKFPLALTKFTSIYFIFVGILIAIIAVLPMIFPEKQLFVKNFWVVFGFMAGITYIAYTLVDIGIKRDPEVGVMAIMGSIAVKMIFCMAFVLVYSIKAKGNGLLFALNFFSVYLLFTAFEIYCLLRNLRHQNLK